MKVEIIRPALKPKEKLRIRARYAGRRMLVAGAALAAGIANAESFRFVPSVSVTESYSDNVALEPGALAKPGWVTDVVPAIRADLSGARVKGLFDLRVHETAYSSDSRLNSTQTYLNSFAKVEAVEDLFFVDARADVGQQNRTVFGTAVTPDLSSPSANRAQTTTLQISPYVRGHFADIANYQLRFNESWVRANDDALPDTRTSEWTGSVRNVSPSAKLGWTIAASALGVWNNVVGKLEDSRIRGSLIYAFNPQFHVSLIEGYEITDFAGPPKTGINTPGIGLAWSPSVRTHLAGVYEKRFFGDGYSAIFSHRTPLSAWSLVSTKDVQLLPGQLISSSSSTIQNLISVQLTSAIPDPEARAEAVRRRLEETGISENSALSSSTITTRPFVFWNSVASVALLGATNTITLSITYREQRNFGVSFAEEGSNADGNYRQRGINANWAHMLSPLTSLTLAATLLQTDGLTITARQSRQYSSSLFLLTQLGPRTSASFGIRLVDFNTSTASDNYRENAVFGAVSVRL